MNVEPVTQEMLAGINLSLNLEEAKLLKDILGKQTHNGMMQSLSKPSELTARSLGNLYNIIQELIMEHSKSS